MSYSSPWFVLTSISFLTKNTKSNRIFLNIKLTSLSAILKKQRKPYDKLFMFLDGIIEAIKLHGLLLFAVFYFIIGLPVLRDISEINYWLLIFLIIPILIIISYISFIYIEKPFMDMGRLLISKYNIS